MPMKCIRSDRIIVGDRLFDGYLCFDSHTITALCDTDPHAEQLYDMTGYYVSPGFIDIHTHGGGGNPFEGSPHQIVDGCNFHLAHGTTSICPTISAAKIDSMARSVENIKAAMSDPRLGSTVIGAHLEGPYLSRSQAGAQCPDFITPPLEQDYLPLMEKYRGVIARWSYAPENDEQLRFTRALAQHGIVASAAHTNATYQSLFPAMEQGCRLVTHLYSCTSTVTRDHGFRSLGVIETAYLEDGMDVEIICDGKHLPPELIRLVYKIKGADRTALVTDSLALTGTSLTCGVMQNTEFIIEDGVCKLTDRTAFAGSIATADRLVHVAVHEAGIPLTDAVKMMTATPARIMGLEKKGRLAPGMDADIVVFDDEINVHTVLAGGTLC